ncbi:transglycosylase domain-containing protein [Terribacillus saccharophilus]|uniref:transglycosylase domain-containing protein n=1 Tax=Terribacillus saccharophilus TaxID=361277 RepID=UPI003981EBDF
MQNKALWTRMKERIAEAWKAGRIQRNSRITYDVIWNLFLFFLLLAGVGIFFAAGAGAGYFASLVKDEPVRSYDSMKEEIYNYEETSSIYFADNVFLGNIKTDLYREDVKLDDISPYVINGIIATEDDNFETHNGVVPKSILRAVMQEATNSETKSGGSTLTQQLVKNQILTNEVSFERKAKEIILAMRLEKVLNKDEILEAYMNIVPFGRNASGDNIAGVQTAAQGIFGVDAKDLTLPQAAFLAGLPQSPSAYSPFTNSGERKEDTALQPGMNRMKQVLNRMLDEGYIDQKEYEDAIAYDITKDFAEAKPKTIDDYGYLTTEVEQRAADIIAIQLAEQDGHSEKDLNNDNDLKNEYLDKAERDITQKGYQIHTTINKDMYVAQQKIAKDYAYYQPDHWVERTNSDGETETVSEPIEAGAMMIENSTGKILSFVGGRDHDKNQVNHATDTKRSNGSTMKPLLVYAPAMEEGTLQPGSVIADVSKKFSVPGQSAWNPGNYGGTYHGLVSARKALEQSYNVPAAKAYLNILDTDPASKYLEKMGVTTLTEGDHIQPAASLGGLDYGMTVEENVNAYATFGNNGEFTDAYMIDSITTKDGKEIFKHKSKSNKVFSPQTNYLMLDMMRGVLDSGTATYANSQLSNKNVDWAGKTGTSQDYHDAWFVATNPNVTVGVWMGYDKQDSIQTSGMGYSQRNQLLWTQLVNSATKIDPGLMAPSASFKQPDGLTKASYCAIGGGKPTDLCKQAGMVKTDLFDVDRVPTKADDSLIRQNGKIVLNPDFVKANELQGVSVAQLFPNNEKVQKMIGKASGGSAAAKSDDKKNTVKTSSGAPLPPTNVQKADKKLTWAQSKTGDVKGYRILQKQGDSFKQIGFSDQSSFNLPDNDSTYQIKAVGKDDKESETITL